MDQNKKLILVSLPPDRITGEDWKKIEQASGGREILFTNDIEEIKKQLDRIEIIVGAAPWELLGKMPELRWYQSWGAGIDGLVDHPELKDTPLQITNTSGIHGEQLREHIFALILAHSRRFPRVFAAQKKHEWLSITDIDVPVIAGKTMLILGYGSIGEQTAKTALAFGMKVIGLRRHPAPSIPGIRIETADKLPDLLGEADYVVNILPHTPDTRGIIGKNEFSLMKKEAVYVNVGRGSTTNEPELIEALNAGRISAALLDVAVQEPLPPDSPLWETENLIISPHYAGMRPDYAKLAMDITLENLNRYNRGETLINLTDKNAGY